MSGNRYSDRVAGNVRAEMARQNRPTAELGAALGVSKTAMTRRLSGQTPFALDELPLIAELLGVPLAQLLGVQQKSLAA